MLEPDIRKLIDDNNFTICLSATEAAAWTSFKSIVRNFLGKRKTVEYSQILGDLLRNYRKMGVRVSLQIYFPQSHLDFFPDHLGDTSNGQGKRLHHDLQKIEKNIKVFGMRVCLAITVVLLYVKQTKIITKDAAPLHLISNIRYVLK